MFNLQIEHNTVLQFDWSEGVVNFSRGWSAGRSSEQDRPEPGDCPGRPWKPSPDIPGEGAGQNHAMTPSVAYIFHSSLFSLLPLTLFLAHISPRQAQLV